jgi:catechol 2,3-dioxygenase-like lactoylglutathione lyase family enzyme
MAHRFSAPFLANNAFFYYADLASATRFYQQVLGCTLVADYGFAKTFHLARSSFLTLVDATKGMHSSSEPKSVTLALVTEQVEAWYDYLTRQGVAIKHELNPKPNQTHDGFVALDPEGYYLEVERFNRHPENEELLPRLAQVAPTLPSAAPSQRPTNLGITATVLWLYYQDVPAIQRFYEQSLGLQQVVDQGWAKIYAASPSGFLGPVVAGKGLHPYSEQKAVTVSLLSDDVAPWFTRLQHDPAFRLHTQEIVRRERYHAFVGYDPEGYFMEFNTFVAHPDNQRLLQVIQQGKKES